MQPQINTDEVYGTIRERQTLDAIEETLNRNKNTSGLVETEKDWETLQVLFKAWAYCRPDIYLAFKQAMKLKRENQFNDFGSAKEKGGAEIRQIGELPKQFEDLIAIAFPKQVTTEKGFMRKLVKLIPDLKIARRI